MFLVLVKFHNTRQSGGNKQENTLIPRGLVMAPGWTQTKQGGRGFGTTQFTGES